MQTVKNETTNSNLVSEGFLQTSIPPLISVFYAKDIVQNFLSQYRKISLGNTSVAENFGYRKTFGIRKGYQYFPLNFFGLTRLKNFVREPLCFGKFLV